MTVLYLDIETIPTQRDDVRAFIAATISPPGNISKAETIAKWNEESRPAAIEEAVLKTGLDGSFGQVFCIGWAFDADPVETICGMDEAVVLHNFGRACRVPPSENFTVTVVGHNVSAFDLRFLAQRYIVNGIRPPMPIARAAQAKPWEAEKVFDTMIQWAGVGQKISLEKLCLALSIPSHKSGIDGSMVWPMVQEGRFDEVATYCAGDVEDVRAIHKRMTFQQWPALAEAA